MSMQPTYPDARLEFDKSDRMRRALRVAGITVEEMADHLEVSRNTVGNWINGRANPRARDMRAFALRTGFPIEWLESGEVSDPRDGGPDGGGALGVPDDGAPSRARTGDLRFTRSTVPDLAAVA